MGHKWFFKIIFIIAIIQQWGIFIFIKNIIFHYHNQRVWNTLMHGEKLSFDILEIGKKKLVLLEIDYFSRKIFEKCLSTKEGLKILKNVNNIFSIKK